LKRIDIQLPFSESFHGRNGGAGAGDGRDAGHAVADGAGADAALVGPRPLATRCVDDEIDGTVGEVVEQIRAPFADLTDGGDVYTVLEQCANSPAGADQSKTHRGQSP